VVIVGGGPAGLCAAIELRRAGADVVLIDEGEELGGQYYRRRSAAVAAVHGDYRPEGTRLVAEVRAFGAKCLTGTTVWGVGDDGRTLLAVDNATGSLVEVLGRTCIVATGAFERPMPFPGWQLPGVVSPGCALHLAHVDVVALGRRVLVAGSGPFLLVAACAVLEAGGGVVAVVEHNRPYRPSLASLSTLRYPRRLAELARYLAVLARHRVPILQGARVLAAEGSGRVERVTIGPSSHAGGAGPFARGGARTKEVDALVVAYGFRPSSELLQLLGAEGRRDVLGDFYPHLDHSGRTSVSGLYAAGEVSGIAGAPAARARGTLAAAAVAADLGLAGSSSKSARLARDELSGQEEFARLVARMFPVRPEDYHAVPDETVVCRCEGVSAGDVRATASLSWNDVSSTKAFTRAGTGPCQSRLCAAALCSLVAQVNGRASRPASVAIPIKPLPWTTLSAVREK
jgi:thioredoxin reductase